MRIQSIFNKKSVKDLELEIEQLKEKVTAMEKEVATINCEIDIKIAKSIVDALKQVGDAGLRANDMAYILN